jgi:UDP-glucuronate decarboxylase
LLARKRSPVTGGASFLGSHLSENLVDGGHEVLCADHFYAGDRETIGYFENRIAADRGGAGA